METGEQIPNTNPNEVMVIGTLKSGGLFSMQVDGAQKHRTGLQIDISGTEGVLRITKPRDSAPPRMRTRSRPALALRLPGEKATALRGMLLFIRPP